MTWFGRAPALWLAAAVAVVQLVAVLVHMGHDAQNAMTVIVTGAYTILVAVLTRPIDLSVVTGAITTIVTAAGVFGWHVSADTISVFNAALVAVATVVLTTLVSPHPKVDPRVRA